VEGPGDSEGEGEGLREGQGEVEGQGVGVGQGQGEVEGQGVGQGQGDGEGERARLNGRGFLQPEQSQKEEEEIDVDLTGEKAVTQAPYDAAEVPAFSYCTLLLCSSSLSAHTCFIFLSACLFLFSLLPPRVRTGCKQLRQGTVRKKLIARRELQPR
jgi:hypothetical protein